MDERKNNHKEANGKEALGLEKMRKSLKQLDSGELDFSEDFLNDLHDRVMQEVQKREIEAPSRLDKTRKYLRAHYRGWLYSSATMSSLFVLGLLLNSHLNFDSKSSVLVGMDARTKALAVAILDSPESFENSLLEAGLGSQFLVDGNAESFENLNISQLRKIMGD